VTGSSVDPETAGSAAGGEAAEDAEQAEHAEHAEVDPSRDSRVPWRVFGAVGVVLGVMFVIYGATSREEAGSAMLAVASILALWCAVFMWRTAKRLEGEPEPTPGAVQAETYLPDASPWPFGIALGVVLALNGLLIGVWFLIPGVMLLAVSLTGFARQSRHRL
jgi:hypothetical protein